ncbi:Ig-like domain-containing protein [Candidatus Pseudothioglobus singularis]|nr:Ig-like domain-containing protein [Candidatus Pseudothioglobus singularis]
MGKREFKYTLNKSHLKAIFALCLFIFSAHSLAAQNRWWVAIDDGTDKYWDDNANWSTTQYGNGGASAPTTNNLIAIFTSASTVDAKLRNNINKIKKLKLLNGYSGNINLNGYHLASSQGPMINDGNVLVTAGSFFQTWGWLYINSGGAVTASGDGSIIKLGHNLSINGGTLTAPSGGSNRFILRGGFNLYGGGVFNHNNGTVTMSTRWRGTPGAAIRIDAGPGTGRNFYNLYKSGNKHATLSTNDIEVENDLTIIGVGSIRAQSNNISVGGDWTLNSWKNFDAGTGKVIFNGSSAQTISWLTNNTRKFKHLQISNSDVSLAKNTGISGTLTIDSNATLDINGKNLTASTLVNNGNLQLSGSETVSISTKDTDSGTITYDGTATGLAYGNTYFNLALNTTGTMTLDADLDVNGSLMITNGTLNTGNNDINVAGNWTNSDSFISGTGKVTFDGTSNIVTGGTGDSNDFYDVTLGGTSAAQSTNAIAIDNNFEITSSGTWYTNCLAMTVSGNTTTGSGSIATTLSPTVTFSPANSATGVVVGSNLILSFNVAVRNTDNSALTDSNVDSLITLKATNSSGSDIAFDATISSDKKVITINPDSDFSSLQAVYVAIGNTVENDCGTALSASSATFTAADNVGPTTTWSPANSATGVAVDSNITLTLNEAVRNIDDSALSDSNVDTLITLKSTNSSGSDIAFDATIDSDKEVITINPTSDFDSEQMIYVAIGATVEDSSGNANTASSITFTAIDSITPTLTFSPVSAAANVANDSNITITFTEAIRNTDDSALTDSNVDSLITLKETNSSGSDIAFDATIDSDKKIITINPNSDFSSEQVIYVAISTTVEDDANNAISASSANFTAREIGVSDITAPTITFSPADLATSIAKDSNITLTFSEAIRNTDNSEITNSNVGSLVTLKATNSSGNDIAFNASIDSAKSVITINPSSDFSSEQVIYIAIGATVEDLYDNGITASSISFTAIDSISPTLAFDPIDLENPVPVTDNITITFNEAIRNTDDTTLTSTNVDSLISLKDTDENGTDIDFNATIDSDKKIITINPDSSLSSEQTVYVAIGATLEDDSNNAITASSITFVAADSTAPNLDFTPADSATGIAVNSDITIAFDEVIRNTDNSALTDSNVDTLITLKTTNSSGSDIAFDAVIDNSKQLITIAPSSDFSSEQVIYVAIGATVEDASDNAISASSITFTAADSTAPTVAFVPPDASNCVPISSNVSLTFNEAVRNPDDSTITDSNVGNLITLEYTSDSSPVAFTATIDSDKKIITINPDSDFVSGEVVNVAIESVEDSSNNTMSATSGTFCVVDSTAPVLTFSPANSSTMVAEETDITLTFNEEIRLIDNSALNNTNVDSLITLKENDVNGDDIQFDATIDADKQVITLDLVSNLSSNQIVYVAIGATVEDSYNNAILADSATFTTGDSLPPTVEIAAVITASIATDSDITFTFSEKIRQINDSEIDNSNVSSLVTLQDITDIANPKNIPFSATINSAKTIITINPTSNFSSQQKIKAIAPANTFEDYSDNLVPETIKTFTAEYLKTSLSNPLNEKDVVGLIEAQIESAKRMIMHSTKPVLKRMEFLRRHNDQKNLSNQGVKLRFVNSSLTEMSNALNLSGFLNQTSDLFGNDWAIWSEGSITIGETDENTISAIKKIKSNGITLGIDKIVDTNQIYGLAIRMEDEDDDIGSSGTTIDTDSFSLSFYGTLPFSEKTYIDGTFGVGKLRTDLTRIHESGTLTGKRKGEQIFSSVLYGAEFNNDVTLSPYGRIDAGYTKLKSYSDSGKVASINYNEQKIKTARVSIGLLIDDEIQTQSATFMPNARIEYGKDVVDASDAVLSYVVYPNTDYTFKIDREETDNFRIGFGTDVLVEGGWALSADFERSQEDDTSYENSISLGASFQPNQNTEYSVSIIGGNSSNRQFGLDYDRSLTDDWTLNASLESAKSSNSGYNNTIGLSTRMSF